MTQEERASAKGSVNGRAICLMFFIRFSSSSNKTINYRETAQRLFDGSLFQFGVGDFGIFAKSREVMAFKAFLVPIEIDVLAIPNVIVVFLGAFICLTCVSHISEQRIGYGAVVIDILGFDRPGTQIQIKVYDVGYRSNFTTEFVFETIPRFRRGVNIDGQRDGFHRVIGPRNLPDRFIVGVDDTMSIAYVFVNGGIILEMVATKNGRPVFCDLDRLAVNLSKMGGTSTQTNDHKRC